MRRTIQRLQTNTTINDLLIQNKTTGVIERVSPIFFKAPKLSSRRKYKRNIANKNDWKPSRLIAIDCETTTDFPKQLRTVQIYIQKYDVTILCSDEDLVIKTAQEKGIKVYSIKEGYVFLSVIPLLGYKLLFYNAGFDLGQIAMTTFHHKRAVIKTHLWKAHLRKLDNGLTALYSTTNNTNSKFIHTLVELLPMYRNNPIIKQYFRNDFNRIISQRIDATFTLYKDDYNTVCKNLGYHLKQQRFILDTSTLATVLINKKGLKYVAEELKIKQSKKDYNDSIPIHEQLFKVMAHAEITYKVAYRLLSILFNKYPFEIDPTSIVSPASLGKFIFSTINLQRPKFKVDTSLEHILKDISQNIFESYYGGKVEAKIRKQLVNKVYAADFVSLYPHVCMLGKIWDLLKAESLIYTEVTTKTQHLISEITLDDLHSPEIWRDLITVCQIKTGKTKGALLPIRLQKRHDNTYIIAERIIFESTGWFTLSDIIASKLRGYEDFEIIKAISVVPEGKQILTAIDFPNGDGGFDTLDFNKTDFYEVLYDLRSRFLKNTPENRLIKLILNSTGYGVMGERNTNDEENIFIDTTVDNPKSLNKDEYKVDKSGVYFNPIISTSITGLARLCLSINEVLAPSLCYQDTDSAFVQTREELECLHDWWKDLIPLDKVKCDFKNKHGVKEYVEGQSFMALGEKRYAVFRYNKDGSPEVLSAKMHGLGSYKNLRGNKAVKICWRYLISDIKNPLLGQAAIRSIGLSSRHIPHILSRNYGYDMSALPYGDFFFISVRKSGVPDKNIINGNDKILLKICQQENSGKTIKDVLDAMFLRESGKFRVNYKTGKAEKVEVVLGAPMYVNKANSKIPLTPQQQARLVLEFSEVSNINAPSPVLNNHKNGFDEKTYIMKENIVFKHHIPVLPAITSHCNGAGIKANKEVEINMSENEIRDKLVGNGIHSRTTNNLLKWLRKEKQVSKSTEKRYIKICVAFLGLV